MQCDVVLRVPLCSFAQIQACDAPVSEKKVLRAKENGVVSEVLVGERPQLLCEEAVPAACPRIQCFFETPKGTDMQSGFAPCRLSGLIQTQRNSSGFWMKLPCSECSEQRRLHPATEGFVYEELAPRN